MPPQNSSKYFDVHVFDKPLADIYNYQNDGVVFLCGDLVSRCGDLREFIEGIDNVPERNVIDLSTNHYGEFYYGLSYQYQHVYVKWEK